MSYREDNRVALENDAARLDMVEKVDGSARFATDYYPPRMLWAAYIRSDYGDARLRSADVQAARAVKEAGGHMLRGGAFKPRSSPYSFRGLEEGGLEFLARAREETGLPVVTEVMSVKDVELVASYADILQIGARNAQNFFLLEEVARRMESNRNAMYKLLHDARRRLKKQMEAEGLSPEDVLAYARDVVSEYIRKRADL